MESNGDSLPDLPNGWEWVKLSKAFELIMGQSPPSSTYNRDRKGLPFFQGKSDFGDVFPSPTCWCNEPKKVAEPGDILISVRAPVGPTNLCKENCCIGRGLAAIRPFAEMPSLFAFQYLRYIEESWEEKATGSTFSAISKGTLAEQDIPLPPLAEQQRIVAKIDSLFEEVRGARDALGPMPVLLSRFRQSVLAKAFRGELVAQDPGDEPASVLLERIRKERKQMLGKKYKEPESVDAAGLPELPEGWEWASVGSVVNDVQYGYTAKSSLDTEGVKYLRITDIQDGNVIWEKVPYCNIEEIEKGKYLLRRGDIVFTRTGATTGKSFLIKECPESVFASYLIRLQPSGIMYPDYLYLFFQSAQYWNRINENSKGTGQPGLNASILKTLTVPLPPLAEQKRIVAKIEQLFALADTIEQDVGLAKKQIDNMEQAILAKAFRGELVPQDPGDEPAGVLLERIRKKGEAGAGKGKKR